MSETNTSYQQEEVDWYRLQGKYPDKRIKNDTSGNLFVVGDHAWNRGKNPPEEIEKRMLAAVGEPDHWASYEKAQEAKRDLVGQIVRMYRAGEKPKSIARNLKLPREKVSRLLAGIDHDLNTEAVGRDVRGTG